MSTRSHAGKGRILIGRTGARETSFRFDRQALFAAVCIVVLLGVIVHAAWLCEDAFITLRTVHNWVNGYGLRWNVAERVQSFTHPLWMMLMAATYVFNPDPTVALLLPSLVISAIFLLLLAQRTEDKRVAGGLILLLGSSKAFVEFSSPGLENPLVHLLLVAYAGATAYTLRAGTGLWRVMALLAFLLVTRVDLLWLVAPSLAVAAWAARKELVRPWPWLALGPFIAWEGFSVFYYGFPAPNTAYAKLATGVPFEQSVAQGLNYLKASLKYDPLTLFSIALACVLALGSRKRTPIVFAMGSLTWLGYLVCVGGDFMLGRLLTPALVLNVLTLACTVPVRVRSITPWAGALTLLASAAFMRSPLWGPPRYADSGWLPENVTDERALAYSTTGLFRRDNPEGPLGHPWVQEALAALEQGQSVVGMRSVGMAGYFAGPGLHIIDEYGLCDPLLARLPATPEWAPGHFLRELPKGYLATLQSGENQLVDPLLEERYSELALIVRGPLLSPERLRLILEWNLRRPVLVDRD